VTAVAGADFEAIAADFAVPGPRSRSLLRWWWPGGAVDADALREQLRGFAAAGWGGVEIQPFRVGLPHGFAAAIADQVHEVFTPRWYAVLATVMDEAAALGLTVDLTFGSAWPFGGGEAVTPELAAQELTFDWTTVHGPGPWRGRPRSPSRPLRFGARLERDGEVDPAQHLPVGWTERIAALATTVAVLAVRGGVPSLGPFAGFVVPLTLPDRWGQVWAPGWIDAPSTIDLSDQVGADGVLEWEVPPGEWQIVVCCRFVGDQRIVEAAGRGPQLVIDHLKRAAFDAHAGRVGDGAVRACARHAGGTWRSVFVDSLEVPADLHWTDDFEAEFLRRRGYALRRFLPLLLQPGWRNCFQARVGAPLFDDTDAGPRVRADYRLTVSELMIERLYAPLAEWAGRHGLQAKTQANGAPVDWLKAYGCAHIPETEDLAGGGAAHFLRVARSAAHLYGRPLVTAEAFCWLLEGLAVTPQKLRERADEFFVHGAQQLVAHGASARLHGAAVDALPWYPFDAMEIGTQLDDANPLWPLMRPLTDYLARCQSVLQRGRAVVPVAVLAPLDLFAFTGAAGRLTPPPWHDALLDAGLDWDWINADALLKGRIEGDIFISPGGHRYRALILPDLPALRAEVAERLAACARAGLPVWAVGGLPAREEGWLDAAARDLRVRAAMSGVQVVAPSTIGRQLRAAGVTPVLDLPAGHGLQFTVREDGDQRWVFLRNPDPQARSVDLAVPAGEGVELWHAWTGRRERLARSDDGPVTVALPACGARLLRQAPQAACVAAAKVEPVGGNGGIARTVSGPWQVQAQGRGLDGRAIAFDETWDQLTDQSQRPDRADFAGRLIYRCEFELAAADGSAGPLWLDLGQVFDAAQVQVNDSAPATGCESPFVFDVSSALRSGLNRIAITVANRPENARRDPAHPGGLPLPGRRLTRLPTGLLGPVRCITASAPATRWQIPQSDTR
jgi:hypothetical protein